MSFPIPDDIDETYTRCAWCQTMLANPDLPRYRRYYRYKSTDPAGVLCSDCTDESRRIEYDIDNSGLGAHR